MKGMGYQEDAQAAFRLAEECWDLIGDSPELEAKAKNHQPLIGEYWLCLLSSLGMVEPTAAALPGLQVYRKWLKTRR
jgi:hypothetical protein